MKLKGEKQKILEAESQFFEKKKSIKLINV